MIFKNQTVLFIQDRTFFKLLWLIFDEEHALEVSHINEKHAHREGNYLGNKLKCGLDGPRLLKDIELETTTQNQS
jgi:hypothetical protein